MAGRAITVTLTLEAAQYLREDRKVQASVAETDAAMKGLDRRIDETGRDMGQLASRAAIAKRELSSLGTTSVKTAAEMKLLDQRIKTQRASVAALADEWLRTGDKATAVSLRQQRSLLGQLERARRDLQLAKRDAVDLVEIVGGLGGKVIGSFNPAEGLSSATKVGGGALGGGLETPGFGPALIGSLVAAIVVAAPGIGAILGGALAGSGVGLLMAGGIVSSFKDPGVVAAAKSAGRDIMSEFFAGGRVFAGPVIESIHILAQDFKDLRIGDVFAKAAPYVTTLARGIGDFVKNLMPGFNNVLDHAGPLTEVFSKGLADTGTAFSDLITDINNSPGTIEGLELGFKVLDGVLRGTGKTLEFLGDVFAKFVHFDATVFGWVPTLGQYFRDLDGAGDSLKPKLHGVGSAAGDMVPPVVDAAHATDHFRTSMQDLNMTVEDSMGVFNDLHGGILSYNQAMFDLKKSLKENGNTFDENTEAGLRNAAAYQRALDAAQKMRDDEIKAGQNADAATKKYNDEVTGLLDLAAQAGVTKTKLDELAGQYIIKISPTFTGTATDWAAFRAGERQAQAQKTKGHASGGWDWGDAPFWAGEQGKELIFPGGRPSYVMTHQQSMAYAGTSGGTTVVRHEHYLNVSVAGGPVRRVLLDDGRARGKSEAALAVAYP